MTSVEFSLNGDRIFAGGIDNQIKVFNIAENKQEETIDNHIETISGLSISFDGTYLLSSSFDQTLKIYDVRPTVNPGNRFKKTLSGYSQGN